LVEEGEGQDRVLVDHPLVDVQSVDTQFHILVEHPALVWPVPSVVQI
jgi:hypothetical protein